MKKKRPDWEINHGKHVHEFLMYDLIKYVAEIDLTKSNIPYDKIKTINKIDVSYNKDNRYIQIEYVDKNDEEQVLSWNIPALYLNDKEITCVDHVTYSPNSNQLYKMNIRLVDGTQKTVYVPVLTSAGVGQDEKAVGRIHFIKDDPNVVTRTTFFNIDGTQEPHTFYNATVNDNTHIRMPVSSTYTILNNVFDDVVFRYSDGTTTTIDALSVIVNKLYNNRTDGNVVNLFRYFYDKFKNEENNG